MNNFLGQTLIKQYQHTLELKEISQKDLKNLELQNYSLNTIKSSWEKIKDDLINPKYKPLPIVPSDIIFEKIILKEKIE